MEETLYLLSIAGMEASIIEAEAWMNAKWSGDIA
jgi:hypothetical protein